jgi:hypothetical protein
MTSTTAPTLLFRLLALSGAVALGITLLPAPPAVAATDRVRAHMFGVHDGNPVTWPQARVGAVRLWDSGVSWREIETAPGTFDFRRLDTQVDTARAHGARVLLVLGMTPRFHSTHPGRLGLYGFGSADMPTKHSWIQYVRVVTRRYQGRGIDYQVWNEGNVEGFWQGSARQLAKLTRWTARVVHRQDASAKIVAPAMVTRLTGQRRWLRTFYAQRVGHQNVAAYVDAVSLNLYPSPQGGPEDSMRLLATVRTLLHAAGVSKPVWNTEINYGLRGGRNAEEISRAREASFVARTYVLNAANKVRRVYWYAWDLQHLANTQLTFADGTSLTRAGYAFRVVRGWLLKAHLPDCSRDGRGTWMCQVRYAHGVRRIYWNPDRRVTVRAVRSATYYQTLKGTRIDLTGGETLRVGKVPVMVRSRA